MVVCLLVRYEPEKSYAVILDDDGRAIVWNRRSGEAIQTLSNPFHGAVSAVVWVKIRDSDENAFVLGFSDGSLHLFKRNTGTVRDTFIAIPSCCSESPTGAV